VGAAKISRGAIASPVAVIDSKAEHSYDTEEDKTKENQSEQIAIGPPESGKSHEKNKKEKGPETKAPRPGYKGQPERRRIGFL
jgi:hypothetical protein